MNNKLLDKMIRTKEGELSELRTIKAYLEEVEKLNRVKVYVCINDKNNSVPDIIMFYKDTKVTLFGGPDDIAKEIVSTFEQAINGVDVYIDGYGNDFSFGTMIGSELNKNPKFKAYRTREVN